MIKWHEVVNWPRIMIVVGTLLTVGLLSWGHYSHAAILAKTAADTPTNWNTTYAQLIGGVLSALVTIIAGWNSTKGMAAVALADTKSKAIATPDETVAVLLAKLEHRLRLDAGNAILNSGGTQ